MGRRPTENPKSAQVNVRMTDEVIFVLEAVAFLDDVTAAEFVREAVEKALHERLDDPLVQRQIQLRQEARARRDGVLHALDEKRA